MRVGEVGRRASCYPRRRPERCPLPLSTFPKSVVAAPDSQSPSSRHPTPKEVSISYSRNAFSVGKTAAPCGNRHLWSGIQERCAVGQGAPERRRRPSTSSRVRPYPVHAGVHASSSSHTLSTVFRENSCAILPLLWIISARIGRSLHDYSMFMRKEPLQWPDAVATSAMPKSLVNEIESKGWWRPMNGHLISPANREPIRSSA